MTTITDREVEAAARAIAAHGLINMEYARIYARDALEAAAAVRSSEIKELGKKLRMMISSLKGNISRQDGTTRALWPEEIEERIDYELLESIINAIDALPPGGGQEGG